MANRYDWLQGKTGLRPPALDELLRHVRHRIIDVPAPLVEAHREADLAMVPRSGRTDAPYVAAGLAVDGVLWTPDGSRADEVGVEVVGTARVLDVAGRRPVTNP